jgi:hypothetical protein
MKRGSGDGRRGAGGSGASVLKALDAFPKIADDFAARTASGGVVTLASLAVMALLFIGELGEVFEQGGVRALDVHSIDALSSNSANSVSRANASPPHFPRLLPQISPHHRAVRGHGPGR